MLTARGKHALNKNCSSVEQDALLSITGFSELQAQDNEAQGSY